MNHQTKDERSLLQRTLHAACAVGIAFGLSGCPTTPHKPQPPGTTRPLPPPALEGATVYRVDGAHSSVAIQVFRGGTLARLGHNHVMTSTTVSGRVWQQRAVEKSGFEVSLPVNELIVDDPEARRRAGSEFPPEIPQADRDGTRKNMLRAEVLDGEHFPAITLRSVSIHGALPEVTAVARITIKGVSHDVELPVSVHVEGSQLKADGMFDIRQTDFGMKPFSIGLGALEVQDRLHVEFHLVGTRADDTH